MYQPEYLRNITINLFEKMGCPTDDARIIADVFLKAELQNLPSHGLMRIKNYHNLWKKGRINTNPDIKIVHETPGTAVVDADSAIGMIGAVKSMKIAILKAEKSGTGWVAVKNSNHFGICAYYAMMALEKDMIGISMTHANPTVAPPNSIERMLGTNPVAMAVPTEKEPPFVADFSTTPITRGKLGVAAKKGEKVPFGYVQDKNGIPSDDPDILKKGGSMLPLGGDLQGGSHKGYALAAMVDILSGVLSGANFGPFIPPFLAYLPVPEVQVGKGMGHFFGAIRIDAFQKPEAFKKRMDKWITTLRSSKPSQGEKVRIPGDIERDAEIKNIKNGISLLPTIQKELKEIADKLGVDFRTEKPV
jgi:LDH2 family malate/lactate/ureidoglycolate dehydrogenase